MNAVEPNGHGGGVVVGGGMVNGGDAWTPLAQRSKELKDRARRLQKVHDEKTNLVCRELPSHVID